MKKIPLLALCFLFVSCGMPHLPKDYEYPNISIDESLIQDFPEEAESFKNMTMECVSTRGQINPDDLNSISANGGIIEMPVDVSRSYTRAKGMADEARSKRIALDFLARSGLLPPDGSEWIVGAVDTISRCAWIRTARK